ncbi:MAG: zinc ribbon domain-containing protein [Proteobacteria bacterium]|nr:zinc ribbon domain-containing protein [Pseudomonadota bacterium]
MICPNCSTENQDDAKFCKNCRYRLYATSTLASAQNQATELHPARKAEVFIPPELELVTKMEAARSELGEDVGERQVQSLGLPDSVLTQETLEIR